eukprot:SAG22_NODE_7_length_40155_cov_25.241356_45_plen_72_part_00
MHIACMGQAPAPRGPGHAANNNNNIRRRLLIIMTSSLPAAAAALGGDSCRSWPTMPAAENMGGSPNNGQQG